MAIKVTKDEIQSCKFHLYNFVHDSDVAVLTLPMLRLFFSKVQSKTI